MAKKDIAIKLNKINAECSTCSKKHELLTTANEVTIDVCSGCHAFYTGDNSVAKSTGRIERFKRRASSAIAAKK